MISNEKLNDIPPNLEPSIQTSIQFPKSPSLKSQKSLKNIQSSPNKLDSNSSPSISRNAPKSLPSSLLRLLQSDSFSLRLAIIYLYRYLHIIGVQAYICDLLLQRSVASPKFDLVSYLPQLVHLAIMNPNMSNHIEQLLIGISLRNPHICLNLYFLLLSYLADLAPFPSSPEFKRTSFLLNLFNKLVFFNNDVKLVGYPDLQFGKSAVTGIYLLHKSFSMKAKLSAIVPRIFPKIKENTIASLIGMSSIGVGVISPIIASNMQVLALVEGSHVKYSNKPESNLIPDKIVPPASDTLADQGSEPTFNISSPSLRNSDIIEQNSDQPPLLTPDQSNSRSTETAPLPKSILKRFKQFKIRDLYKSSPSLSKHQIDRLEKSSHLLNSRNSELVNARKEQQKYFSSQLKFITELLDIPKRIILVGKENRQASLEVELNVMNHFIYNNPVCCIPPLCKAHLTDKNFGNTHDVIVRIPASEAVVLNSAERAPYLLVVEVLRSFNKDDLPKPQPPSSTSGASLQSDSAHSKHRKSKSRSKQNGLNKHLPNNPAPIDKSTIISIEEIDERMKTASILLNQLNNHQKLLLKSNPSQHPKKPAPQPSKYSFSNQITSSLYKLASISAPSTFSKPPRPASSSSSDPNSKNKISSPNTSATTPPFASEWDGDRNVFKFFENLNDSNNFISLQSSTESPVDNLVSKDSISSSGTAVAATDDQTSSNPIISSAATDSQTSANPIISVAADSPSPNEPKKSTVSTQRSYSLKNTNFHVNSIKPTPSFVNDPSSQIRANLVAELMSLQEQRMRLTGGCWGYYKTNEDAQSEVSNLAGAGKGDQSAVVLGENWDDKKKRIRASSPFGNRKNWDLISVIVKEGADLRQEKLALQLIGEFHHILKPLGIYLKSYEIMVVCESGGLIETINNSVSIHSIKKVNNNVSLLNYFVKQFGTKDTETFKAAQRNFMLSLVGYSLVCFFLQLKDRHNGNILIDNLGNLIHIDFGFMLNNSPGAIGFETAPFKFTQEYLELLAGVSVGNVGHLEMKRVSSSIAEDSVADTDGVPDSNGGGTAASGSSSGPLSGQISSLTESELFKEFKQLMKEGFKAIRKNSDFIVSL
ncbi:Phosphatidylinositol 4-kinase pik1, partial [Smittium mucronatum]